MLSLRKAAEGRLNAAERKSLLKQGLAPFLFEVELWAQAKEVRGHYLWGGPVDRHGKPLYISRSKGLRFSAAREAWLSCREEYPPGELEPACGFDRCIRPEHQAVKAP